MWFFWIDPVRKGKRVAPDERRRRIHIYMGEDLGGGYKPLRTVCGRIVLGRDISVVADRMGRWTLRGRVCKKCLPALKARMVAEKMMDDKEIQC